MLSAKIDLSALQKLKDLPRKIEQAIVATNIQLWQDVVESAPVITGFARASWFPSLDQPLPGPMAGAEPPDPESGVVLPPPAMPASTLTESAGRTFFLANSAPYIARLEYEAGFSPRGYGQVRAAVTKYQINLEANIARLVPK